jgi:NAD(P)-dependent dehydrogenase (short-subunit alcohol dehydrogenase family)
VLHGRDESALAAAQAQITDIGGEAMSVTGDVTVAGDLVRIHDRIIQQYGHVDVLVANAGSTSSRPAPIEDITEESWRADIERYLTGTFLTVKQFLPGMKQRRTGNIITVSSAAGRKPSERTIVAYAAAKAGVQLFTQDLAAQAGPFGIRANCIAPETIFDRDESAVDTGRRPTLPRRVTPTVAPGHARRRRRDSALSRVRSVGLDHRRHHRRRRRRRPGMSGDRTSRPPAYGS